MNRIQHSIRGDAAYHPATTLKQLEQQTNRHDAAYPARLLAAAMAYQRRGWHLFPTDGADGKHPAVRWGTAASNDLEQILTWFTLDGFTGIGIACGPSHLYVVDVDAYKPEAAESLRWLTNNGYLLPRTLSAVTPSGGAHYYYYATASPALRNSNAGLPGIERKLGGIDARGDGGFVVAPPTRRADGTEYEFLPEERWAAQPAPYPNWLRPSAAPAPPLLLGASPAVVQPLEQIERLHYAFAALRERARSVEVAEEGTRQTTLFQATSVLGRLVARGYIDRLPVEQELSTAAGTAGLGAKEIRATLKYHLDRELDRLHNRGPATQKATNA